MDRSWINADRLSDEYSRGVEEFLEFAKSNDRDNNGLFHCPCVECVNVDRRTIREIRDHLIYPGFCKSYTKWIWHGDPIGMKSESRQSVEVDDGVMEDQLEDMIRDIGPESFQRAHVYDSLCEDLRTPLYPGCNDDLTRLSAVLNLFNLKARNGWTDKSFTELLKLLKDMLPEGDTLPDSNYEAKKILCPMGMEYQKIHACPNDCILYRKEYEGLHECPVCGKSRYKVKDGDDSNVDDEKKKGLLLKCCGIFQ